MCPSGRGVIISPIIPGSLSLSPLLLVTRIHGVVDERLVVVGPHEARVAVPLEQRVHVLGGNLEGVARRHRRLHRRLGRLHRLAVDVDLGLGARRQEFAAKSGRNNALNICSHPIRTAASCNANIDRFSIFDLMLNLFFVLAAPGRVFPWRLLGLLQLLRLGNGE